MPKKSNSTVAVIVVLICILTGVLVLVVAGARRMSATLASSTDVRQYEAMLSKGKGRPTIAHFPKSIPADARDTRMFYDAGALQAATVLELRYTTTPAKIAELSERFSRQQVAAFPAGTKDGILEPRDFTASTKHEPQEFTADFVLFYLSDPPNEERDWNHPKSLGVAISKKRNVIVYWMWSG